MKPTAALLLLLVAAPAFAQTATTKEEGARQYLKYKDYEKRGLIWRYDAFRNETLIVTKPQLVSMSLSGPTIVMSIGIRYPGSEMPAAGMDAAVLGIKMSAQQWQQLKSDRQVRMMFEGANVVLLGTADYDGDVKAGESYITRELLYVPIKLTDIERLAAAKIVMFQVGRLDFLVKEKQLKKLEPIIAEMKASKTP